VARTKNQNRKSNPKQARAIDCYLRISTQRMKLVADQVRKLPTSYALAALSVAKQKGAKMILKVLKSAVANAKGKGLDLSKLYVADVRADKGPTLKRIQPRAMGRADTKLRRMTHLSVVVCEGNKIVNPELVVEAKSKTKKKVKAKA